MTISKCQIILIILILSITVTGTIFIITNGFESQADCDSGYKYDRKSSKCWKCPDGYRKKLWQKWDSNKACEQKGMFKFKTKAAVSQKKKSTVITPIPVPKPGPEPSYDRNDIEYLYPSSFQLIDNKYKINEISGSRFNDATVYNLNYQYVISFYPGDTNEDTITLYERPECGRFVDRENSLIDCILNENNFTIERSSFGPNLTVVIKGRNLSIGKSANTFYEKNNLEPRFYTLRLKRSPTEWNIYLDGHLAKTVTASHYNPDRPGTTNKFKTIMLGDRSKMNFGVQFFDRV